MNMVIMIVKKYFGFTTIQLTVDQILTIDV